MSSGKAILVVDDQLGICLLLQEALRSVCDVIHVAQNGFEAISKLQERSYDLILMDLKMSGGLNGLETLVQIRNLHIDTPAWLITAYGEAISDKSTENLGIQCCISKPFDLLELIEKVEKNLSVNDNCIPSRYMKLEKSAI